MNYKEKRLEVIKKSFPSPSRSLEKIRPTTGNGLVNSIINKMLVELHVPGYKYLGPGTNLDLRLLKRSKPKNKLDEAAMQHDIAYSKSEKIKDRHVADKVLQEAAWNRVKAPDATLGGKAVAWLTTNTMKAKRAIGAGLPKRKTPKNKYTSYPVYLGEMEKEALTMASQNKKPLTLSINLQRTRDSVMSETFLPLTKYQIEKIKKAQKQKKNTISTRISVQQLSEFKEGGFLPALLAAAPAIAAVGSLVTSGINAYNNKKANDRLVEETIRHNRALESTKGEGLYLNKKPRTVEGGNPLLKELMLKKKRHSVE